MRKNIIILVSDDDDLLLIFPHRSLYFHSPLHIFMSIVYIVVIIIIRH